MEDDSSQALGTCFFHLNTHPLRSIGRIVVKKQMQSVEHGPKIVSRVVIPIESEAFVLATVAVSRGYLLGVVSSAKNQLIRTFSKCFMIDS